jgi:hypothetical protein
VSAALPDGARLAGSRRRPAPPAAVQQERGGEDRDEHGEHYYRVP